MEDDLPPGRGRRSRTTTLATNIDEGRPDDFAANEPGVGASSGHSHADRLRRVNSVARCLALFILGACTFGAALVHGQDVDPDDDDQLTAARLLGGADATEVPPTVRPQLEHSHEQTKAMAGSAAAVVGVSSLAVSWALYVARQNYRLRPWSHLDASVMDGWESRGSWAFWLSVASSASFVSAEHLLLPDEPKVPMLAWLAGGAGLIAASVGIAYAVDASHCGPQAASPGARLIRDCLSGTSDALFGPMVLLAAVPLVNIPLTYLVRSLFRGAPESLSFTPAGLTARVHF